MPQIESIKFLVESHVFGVCERIGDKLNMPAKNIRLFFIYASCMTVGSPIIIYMILAFWIKMKDYGKGKRNPVWDF
jgi:phage shock protein PspC (stress-responsive transcriptional regulator)